MKEEFKLPSSSYKELVKIIRAYGSYEKGASLPELNKISGIHNTIISSNNKFLLSINLISGGNIKIPSPSCLELSRAFSYNNEGEISRLWRNIVSSSDFLTKMLTAIKIRNGMDEQGFANHISYSSGQMNSAYTKTGAGTLIEIFKIAKLVKEEDGKLIFSEFSENELPQKQDSEQENINVLLEGRKNKESELIVNNKSDSTINVNFQINIAVSVSELEELSGKLTTIIKSIKENI
ncbi:MAG: hypothetical protein ABSF81_17000 [Bacteroidales bacterium]